MTQVANEAQAPKLWAQYLPVNYNKTVEYFEKPTTQENCVLKAAEKVAYIAAAFFAAIAETIQNAVYVIANGALWVANSIHSTCFADKEEVKQPEPKKEEPKPVAKAETQKVIPVELKGWRYGLNYVATSRIGQAAIGIANFANNWGVQPINNWVVQPIIHPVVAKNQLVAWYKGAPAQTAVKAAPVAVATAPAAAPAAAPVAAG